MLPDLKKLIDHNKTILGIDPGRTTGVCIIKGHNLIYHDELKSTNVNIWCEQLLELNSEFSIQEIACEDYKVYKSMIQEHAYKELHEVKIIGATIMLTHLHNIKMNLRMAGEVKSFVTDKKLKSWDLYKVGKRHSRDAIRHAIYCSIFNN